MTQIPSGAPELYGRKSVAAVVRRIDFFQALCIFDHDVPRFW